MTAQYQIRSEFEARTHEKFANYMRDTSNLGWRFYMVKRVFIAMWNAAMTLDKIVLIGSAMESLEGVDANLIKEELDRLVEAGVLRIASKKSLGGQRLYAVDYN